MRIAAIIPARYHSTRFEGKPLVSIAGVPMIQRVYRQVEGSNRFLPQHIAVATDDHRIESVVKSFGGNAIMTSPNHRSGSERIWEVLEKMDVDAAINIQGDEPAVPEELISQLYRQLETGAYDVVTPAYYNTSYNDFLSQHNVKVVVDTTFRALYFSRSPIPFTAKDEFKGFYHHIGIYGYLKKALGRFVQLPASNLEKTERLEQLRFLDNGMSIKVIISEYKSVGVDVPEDVQKVEELLASQSGQELI